MRLSNIASAFKKCRQEHRPALLTYTVSGDPNKKKSFEILKAISSYADICEIGIGHNCNTGDGKQIQNSTYRAIKNGIKIKDTFAIVKKFKKTKKAKPCILMGYYNSVVQYGENQFIKKCKQVGVDGLIVVDLPWPENKNFSKKCKKNSINFVQLVSPTTSSYRMKRIINDSHNMIYYISMLSTTGGKLKVSPREILKNYNRIKKMNKSKNLVIGFGITDKTISSLKKTDGLVVGSALCKEISKSIKNRQNPVTNVSNMVKNLREKIVMNWITRWKKIGIRVKQILKKQPSGQEETDWKNCPQCKKISYLPDLIANSYICECNFHFDLPPKSRLDNLFDSAYEIIEAPQNINPDPLNFEVGEKYKYIDKIKKYRKITGQTTALMCASGNISNLRSVVVCFNPKFGGGRFGPAENEHFLKASNFAIKEKVDIWVVIYQSSGIDVHTGITGLAGMTKSIIAMNEIKKNNIPTFCIAARATAGGTYASSFFMHDFIIIESKCVENLLFSGKRVTANILKGTDQIPDDFGTGPGVMKSGLADITLESRKELKWTITKLANIILKKEKLKPKNVEESHENPEDFKKAASTTS